MRISNALDFENHTLAGTNQPAMQQKSERNPSPTGRGASKPLSLPAQQPQKVRKRSWFNPQPKTRSNNPIRQSLKKNRKSHWKKKKIDYRDMRHKHWLSRKFKKSALDRQPAAPHNTTQFIMNTVHFPTDPYVYDFDDERFPEDKFNHSMLGSMRSRVQLTFEQPMKSQEENQDVKDNGITSNAQEISKEESKSDNISAEVKGFKNCFPENAYDLMKGKSESDINSLCDCHSDRRAGSLGQTSNLQTGQIDIKSLIEEVKNGQNNLEDIIKSLVSKIKERDEIITNLKGAQ